MNVVTAVSVFVEVDGSPCLAPIAPEAAQAFLAMLAAFQSGQPTATNLIRLPESVAKHVRAAGRAIVAAKKDAVPA